MVKKADFIRYIATLFLLSFLVSCKSAPNKNNLLPDVIFSVPNYENDDAIIFHPKTAIHEISDIPENPCEREQLRRYVILTSMYSEAYLNQDYYIDTSSDGFIILLEAFPIVSQIETREGGKLASLKSISQLLREVAISCGNNG